MRPSKFTDDEIELALRQVQNGMPAVQVCRKLGITETTFYRWRAKHGSVSETRAVRELREENRKLKQIVADLLLENRQAADAPRRKH